MSARAIVTFVVAAAALSAAPARAATLALGVTGGLTRADAAREPWQWDMAPHAAWGLQATAGFGRVALGARFERVQSRQSLGLPSPAPASLAVRGDAFEALARFDVLRIAGVDAVASVAAGRTRWNWTPDVVAVDTGAGVVEVAFTPVSAPGWALGGGVTRSFGAWTIGAFGERRYTRMDSAHRAGDGVALDTETFGDWNARIELSRLWSLGPKGAM